MSSLSLQNAYHLYLQNYAHSLPGVPENQRKADLKDTSRMIAKLNSNSPTYVNASALAFRDSALQLKKITLDLEQNIEPFHKVGDSEQLPEQMAYSPDESIADVRYAPEYSTNPVDSFTLEIERVAREQINKGVSVSDSGQGLSIGTHSFNLSFDHMNYEFQFDVKNTDTNLSIGQKVAGMIQNAHIGIAANMVSNGNGTSYMELKTLQTGIAPDKDLIFSVSDKPSLSGPSFVQYFGIDYVSQFPESSSFKINGNELSSQSNNVTLTNGFLLTLKKPTVQPLNIGLKTDTETITAHIGKYVSSYNRALQNIIDLKPPSSSLNVLADKLAQAPSSMSGTLEKIGITMDSEHRLTFDSEVLKNSLDHSESGKETKELLKPLYQLSDQISEILSKAILDPITFTNSAIASYKNITRNNYANPYVSSAYAGMYFNAYR